MGHTLPMQITDRILRVEVEAAELKTKLDALITFLHKDTSEIMTQEMRNLLIIQQSAMQTYYDVLLSRLSIMKAE